MRISALSLILLISFHAANAYALSDAQLDQIVRAIQDSNAHNWLEYVNWCAQIILVFGAFLAAKFARAQVIELKRQLQELKRSRDDQNAAAILERTAEHNWKLAEDDNRLKAVEIFARLTVPADSDERKLYWATRLSHMSHVLLLQQVWIFAGRKKLTGPFQNWERFAVNVAKDLRGTTGLDTPEAYKMACADYWKGLEKFEETEPDFVKWLTRISD